MYNSEVFPFEWEYFNIMDYFFFLSEYIAYNPRYIDELTRA